MTFLEQELRKIVNPVYPDAVYVGRACYIKVGDQNRAKIAFVTTGISNQYSALRMTMLNRREGEIDSLLLRFTDLLGKKMTSNPNFRNGIDPHIWEHDGKMCWYGYQPSKQDYSILSDSVSQYIEVFMEQNQDIDQSWSQTMR